MHKSHHLPLVGMRIIKSAVAVSICLIISTFLNREEMRIYSSLAALWCIQPYYGDMKKNALQRICGTAVGSVYGVVVTFLEICVLDIRGTIPGFLLVSVFIVLVLWTTVCLKVQTSSYYSCVVFLSITVAHITDSNPWMFIVHRISETLLGIVVGILINAAHLPRKKQRDILFVAGMDGVLLNMKEEMTPYSRVQLNRMLDDGALITISTIRTPGSVMEAAEGLRFRLPVIVMDGAAMYDLKKMEFLHANDIPQDLVHQCSKHFEKHGVQCFINGVLDNVLIIYHGELKNEAERDIFKRLHTSPYRNYVDQRYYDERSLVLYLLAVGPTEKMQQIYDEFLTSGLAEQVRLRFYPSARYPGFSFIRVYEKDASRQNMLEQLKKDLGVTKTVTFGKIDGETDVVLHDESGNRVVKVLGRMYQPYIWEKTKK